MKLITLAAPLALTVSLLTPPIISNAHDKVHKTLAPHTSKTQVTESSQKHSAAELKLDSAFGSRLEKRKCHFF